MCMENILLSIVKIKSHKNVDDNPLDLWVIQMIQLLSLKDIMANKQRQVSRDIVVLTILLCLRLVLFLPS